MVFSISRTFPGHGYAVSKANASASNAVLTIFLPSGAEFVSASVVKPETAQASVVATGTQAVIRVPSIAAGQSVQLTLTVKPLTAGDLYLQVSASSDDFPGGTAVGATLHSMDMRTPQLCGLGAGASLCATAIGLWFMRSRRWA